MLHGRNIVFKYSFHSYFPAQFYHHRQFSIDKINITPPHVENKPPLLLCVWKICVESEYKNHITLMCLTHGVSMTYVHTDMSPSN